MKSQKSKIKSQNLRGVTREEGLPTTRMSVSRERALAGGKLAAGPRAQSGQSLIEVLIALAASVAVVSAITVTVITSLSNAEFTKNQNLATQYSRQGMEIVRQIAKNNWTDFLTYTNRDYCLNKESTTLSTMTGLNCGLNIDNIFDRKITIIQSNSTYCTSSAEIISSVSWSDSKCQTGNILCHDIKLRSCLAEVNAVRSP